MYCHKFIQSKKHLPETNMMLELILWSVNDKLLTVYRPLTVTDKASAGSKLTRTQLIKKRIITKNI